MNIEFRSIRVDMSDGSIVQLTVGGQAANNDIFLSEQARTGRQAAPRDYLLMPGFAAFLYWY